MKSVKEFLRINIIVYCMAFCVACGSLGSLAGMFLSNADAAAGLKDALTQGMFRGFNGVEQSNTADYALIQFVMPGEAQDIIRTLNAIGLGPVVNRVTQKFDNVIKGSVAAAKPILLNSIKQMTFSDALGILVTSNPHAATDYFKNTNYNLLLNAISPVVDSNLQAYKAKTDWDIITAAYNVLPVAKKPLERNPTEFLSARIIDGMCSIIAKEEEKIRSDISARTTEAMRRAFGYADQQKSNSNQQSTPRLPGL